jgi:hypothetical protein
MVVDLGIVRRVPAPQGARQQAKRSFMDDQPYIVVRA